MAPAAYATPQLVSDKLGDELLQILNLPSTVDVVTPATQLFENGVFDTPPASTAIEVAARRLAAACKTANGTVETALRASYTVPLPLAPDEVLSHRYPDITGAAVALVKWELLAPRGDIRSAGDRTQYTDALRYLGIGEDGKVTTGGTISSLLDLTTGDAGSPRGAQLVRIGDPEKTRQRRATMTNAPWIDEY